MKTYTKLLDKTISTEMIEIGYNKTDKGYIIGRKSSWTSKGITHRLDGFSKSIGLVALGERDSHLPDLIEQHMYFRSY